MIRDNEFCCIDHRFWIGELNVFKRIPIVIRIAKGFGHNYVIFEDSSSEQEQIQRERRWPNPVQDEPVMKSETFHIPEQILS